MKQPYEASVDAILLTYFNPSGLTVISMLGTNLRFLQLWVIDLIFDLTLGLKPRVSLLPSVYDTLVGKQVIRWVTNSTGSKSAIVEQMVEAHDAVPAKGCHMKVPSMDEPVDNVLLHRVIPWRGKALHRLRHWVAVNVLDRSWLWVAINVLHRLIPCIAARQRVASWRIATEWVKRNYRGGSHTKSYIWLGRIYCVINHYCVVVLCYQPLRPVGPPRHSLARSYAEGFWTSQDSA